MTRCNTYADALMNYIRAGRKDVSRQELRTLAGSSLERVRLRVAENPRCPKDALESLACDPSPDVRSAVALNPSTPRDLVAQLCMDDDPTVRYAIAEDPQTDVNLLRRLSCDHNAYVSCRAQRTLQLLESYTGKNSFGRSFDGNRILRSMKRLVKSQTDLQFA